MSAAPYGNGFQLLCLCDLSQCFLAYPSKNVETGFASLSLHKVIQKLFQPLCTGGCLQDGGTCAKASNVFLKYFFILLLKFLGCECCKNADFGVRAAQMRGSKTLMLAIFWPFPLNGCYPSAAEEQRSLIQLHLNTAKCMYVLQKWHTFMIC